MALAAKNPIMEFSFILWLLTCFITSGYAFTKNFVNTSMPDMRPTFVVNFDMATVICQHSNNAEDLHLHDISILCNGVTDCFNNPAMHDESFPYCKGKCNSTCNNRGACLYDGEKAQCYCNSGFHGPSCEITDKNECQDKPCHWLAHCTNTINSTKCDCFPGFKGNGHECTDIDECAENLANCPEYSQCVNLPGTFFCNCTSGFMPKSALMPKCMDIDECATDMHNCADGQYCQNTFGSFECVKECSKGYHLNESTCDDIDECLESHRCDKRARCENTSGGYKCICDEGFTGDGHSCSPITDCSKNENICHRHGFCIASLKMCICETGYAGDGMSCHDVNECEASGNPCKDQSGNKCVNIEGGYICCDSKMDNQECIEEKGAYCSGGCGLHAICFNQTCTCVDGFEGDPKVRCNDVNECENESFCPGVGQWCVNMLGGYICCGRDSTHPECKGLEINAFDVNYGNLRNLGNASSSLSKAQLAAEGKHRAGFTHIIEKGGKYHNESGGVVVVFRGNETDSSGEAMSSNGVTFSLEIPTCNIDESKNTTICPLNSECIQGRCLCIKGFEWGRTSGSCIDINECEKLSSPCLNGADVWCVNLPGSYQCCNTTSPESECLGLEISPSGIFKGQGGDLKSSEPYDEDSKSKIKNQGKWVIESGGQWKNESGGKIIVTKGKVPSNPILIEATTSGFKETTKTKIVRLPARKFIVTTPNSGETGAEIESEETSSQSGELITQPLENIEKWPGTSLSTIAPLLITAAEFTLPDSFTDNSTELSTSLVAASSSTMEGKLVTLANEAEESTTHPSTSLTTPRFTIADLLKKFGVITNKVTSKPVMLVTAGSKSIEEVNKETSYESTETTTLEARSTEIYSTANTGRKNSFTSPATSKSASSTKMNKNVIDFSTTNPLFTDSDSSNLISSTTPFSAVKTTTKKPSKNKKKTSNKKPKKVKTTSSPATTTPILKTQSKTKTTKKSGVTKKKFTAIAKQTASSSATSPLPVTNSEFITITTESPDSTKATTNDNFFSTTQHSSATNVPSSIIPESSTTTDEEDEYEMEVAVTMRSTTNEPKMTKTTKLPKRKTKPSSKKFQKGMNKNTHGIQSLSSKHMSTIVPEISTNTSPHSVFLITASDDSLEVDYNTTTATPISTTTNFEGEIVTIETQTTSNVFTNKQSEFTQTTSSSIQTSESLKPLVTNFESTTTSEIDASEFVSTSPKSTLSSVSGTTIFPMPEELNVTGKMSPEIMKTIISNVSKILGENEKVTTSSSYAPTSSELTLKFDGGKTSTQPQLTPSSSTNIQENLGNTVTPQISGIFISTTASVFDDFSLYTTSTSSQQSTPQSTSTTIFIPPQMPTSPKSFDVSSTESPSTQATIEIDIQSTQSILPLPTETTLTTSLVTEILGSTTKKLRFSATKSTTNADSLTTTNTPLTFTDYSSSTLSTKKFKGMQMIFIDEEETTLTSFTDDLKFLTAPLPTHSSTELTDLIGSTSAEIVTSGEKGLEISVITTPFKQGSSTDVPKSTEVGLEISGIKITTESGEETTKTTEESEAESSTTKSTTISKEVLASTLLPETSSTPRSKSSTPDVETEEETLANVTASSEIKETTTPFELPETIIETPEDGEHLTQEVIERLNKLKPNQTTSSFSPTSTTALLEITSASTTAGISPTTEDTKEKTLSNVTASSENKENTTPFELPETIIETPEDGKHLTQEEIEKLKKLNANETSTSVSPTSRSPLPESSITSASTPAAIFTTTEDLSHVASGEQGLELSIVTTEASAEEFTSEPATAISSTTEKDEGLELKGGGKAPPRSHESSLEKVPHSGEQGLEILGHTPPPTLENSTSSVQPNVTDVEATTDAGEITTTSESSTASKESSTSSVPLSEIASTSVATTEGATLASTEKLTTVEGTFAPSSTKNAVTESVQTLTSEKASESESSTETSTFSSTPNKVTDALSTSTSELQTKSITGSTVEPHEITTESKVTESKNIEASSIPTTPSPESPTTFASNESTLLPESVATETSELTTTEQEMGLELNGKEFNTTPLTAPESNSSTITAAETTATSPTTVEVATSTKEIQTTIKLETNTPFQEASAEFETELTTHSESTSSAGVPLSTVSRSTTNIPDSSLTITEEPFRAITIPQSELSTPKAPTSSTIDDKNVTSAENLPESSTTLPTTEKALPSATTENIETTSGPTTIVREELSSTPPSELTPTKEIGTSSATTEETTSAPPSTTPAEATSTQIEEATSSPGKTKNTPPQLITGTPESTFTAASSTEASSTASRLPETSEAPPASRTSESHQETETPFTSVAEFETTSAVEATTTFEINQPSTTPTATIGTSATETTIKLETPVTTNPKETTSASISSTESSVATSTPLSSTAASISPTEVTDSYPSSTPTQKTSSTPNAETTSLPQSTEAITTVSTTSSSPSSASALPEIIVDKSGSGELENESLLFQTTTSSSTTVTESEAPSSTSGSKPKCLSNDECEGDSYCERRSGVCRCKPGFEGQPPNKPCKDVDECNQKLDDCHSTSRCLNYNGGYHCVCAIGYRKNENGICEDIDECAASNGTLCDPHAVCRNLPGAYLCECNAGYTGDGYNCISIDKRHCNQNEWAKSDCGRNHFCLVDANGKIDCDVCKNGFIMKNGICSDINECEKNSKLCHADAICQNTMGGYQCRCQPGYAGDGHNCKDIDECGIQNYCHPQATCVNTPGSCMCECPEGWTGDGKTACLNPIDQACSQREKVCLNGRKNSACLSIKLNDGFKSECECLPNYRFNATTETCDDIDECSQARDNCDSANTICVNTQGSFQCHCAPGYEGNGGVCVDIDECNRGLAGCHVNAHCINRIGGVECRCGAGYTGDGTDCFPLDNRQTGGSDCNEDWVDMCRSLNKTCHIDDEEVPQCGSCMFGYQPMDGKCQPINAIGNCADPYKNDCDQNAECIDVRPGRHFCSCKIGFIGDGMHCDDVDECSIPRLCDFHATCKNTNGSYECQCKEGFIGNGFKCVPANQSQNCRISPEICHSNAGCQPDGTCKCLRGFEGDGVTECKGSPFKGGEFGQNELTSTRRPLFTTDTFFTSSTTDGRKCSTRDRTACHVLATCDLDIGECVCRQGFMGDGYLACTRIWEDCTADRSMCHSNATCDNETRQCQCNLGFLGDGISCVPDKMDCMIRSNLCSEMAECVARRCVCGPGFTGDGSICVPVEPPQFMAGNCTFCHIQSICANGGCRCTQGCFGNGILCVPDPEDCLNYPGVCHMNGFCDAKSRRCSCKKGFSGNGLDCSKRISCKTDSNICHNEATCLSDGRCECNHGLIGDGVECVKPLTAAEIFGTSAPQLIHFECPSSCGVNAECINGACKCLTGYVADENSDCKDMDECKMQTAQCHAQAECINLDGTYQCQCLSGYSGDGKECSPPSSVLNNPDGLQVECKDDGISVVLIDETSSFNGRIFVRGQSENPHCTKTFGANETLPLSFHIPIAHCDLQLEPNDTLATTVVIQKHPLFVTEQAYAYRLKCTYPTATRNIMYHYNVSEITTAETINTKGVEPSCQLTVTNEKNVTIDSAIVGQVLKLALFVLPNNSFTVLPRNCYAINLETSQRYTLTDEAGCAIDAQLFPEWKRINPSLTHATFRTFKWPDSSMIRFECDCSACVSDCPEINCERRRQELQENAQMRYARDQSSVISNQKDENESLWLKNGQIEVKPTSAFSSVVIVMDDAEEQMAQKQVEEWLNKGSLQDSEFFSNIDEERICVGGPWALLCLLSIIFSLSLIISMTQIYKQRISKKKAASRLSTPAPNLNDNNSAYIKF